MYKKIILCLCLFLVNRSVTHAQAPFLEQPYWSIISDYGPRHITYGSWFHKGIDYGGTEGESIFPVEAGLIKAIGYDGGWYMDINGSNRDWIYLHIFSGTDTNHPLPVKSSSGEWELRNATLEDISNGTTKQSNIIR